MLDKSEEVGGVCEEGERRGGVSEGRWCSSSSRGGMYGVGDGGGDGGGGFRRKLLGLWRDTRLWRPLLFPPPGHSKCSRLFINIIRRYRYALVPRLASYHSCLSSSLAVLCIAQTLLYRIYLFYFAENCLVSLQTSYNLFHLSHSYKKLSMFCLAFNIEQLYSYHITNPK